MADNTLLCDARHQRAKSLSCSAWVFWGERGEGAKCFSDISECEAISSSSRNSLELRLCRGPVPGSKWRSHWITGPSRKFL